MIPFLIMLICSLSLFATTMFRKSTRDGMKILLSIVHISGPRRASNTTKIPRKDPQEREEGKKTVAGEGQKKKRNFGPHLSGAPPFGSPPTRTIPHFLLLSPYGGTQGPLGRERGWEGRSTNTDTFDCPAAIFVSLIVLLRFFFILILVFFLVSCSLCWAKRLKHQFGTKSAWPNSAIQILAQVGLAKVERENCGYEPRGIEWY